MNWRQRAAMGCMACTMLLMGCGHEKTEDTIGMSADSFATMYFNWKLAEALPHCTGESQRWIRYAASQVCEADVDTLRSKDLPATVECTGVSYQEGDSTATAQIVVRHFWEMDQAGMGGRMVDEAPFTLRMVQQAGRWLVRMEGLPQSEKTGRD
ncbi:MAG: hypothetical protein ACI3YX_01640 [Prevotella sp.]